MLSRADISEGALKVLDRLQREGYKPYLVGGGVRDLLLQRRPKDFDVATNARPSQVRRLFRNARIIGRRFQLVHVVWKDEVVEVSTFRGAPDPEEQRRRPGELLVTSDNTFGTPREDAFRRDFTVNALFYDIGDQSVIDFVGGLDDLERRLIRTIGDPDLRFREDPVRMLRACEFAGRLGFSIEAETQRAIERHRTEIAKASPARLAEELLQLLRSGHAGATAQWLLELGLVERLLPELVDMWKAPPELGEFARVLPALDRAIAEGAKLSDAGLVTLLLVPRTLVRRSRLEARGAVARPALRALNESVVASFVERFALSRARVQQVLSMLETFERLCEPPPPRARLARLVARPSFGEALRVFTLLVDATGQGQAAALEWREAQRAAPTPDHEGAPRSRRTGRRRGGRQRRRQTAS